METVLKPLPELIKLQDKNYVIFFSCENDLHNIETFTYVVAYKDKGVVHIQNCESIRNRVKYESDSLVDYYAQALEKFYDKPVINIDET